MEKIKKLLRLKKVWIPLVGLIALLVVFGVWGSFYYSKARLIERYVAAYQQSGDTFENIKEYLVWSDTGEKVTNDEAKYAEFTALDEDAAQALSQKLKSAQATDEMYVTRAGSRFGIFPDYKVALKPLALTLTTNVSGMDLLLNGKKVAVSDSETYSMTLERLPIADYTARLSGTYDDKSIDVSKSYDGQSTTLDLSVTFKTFTVTSNLTDGELYFDETRVGTLTDGSYTVSDYPLTDSAQVFVKKAYADGDLTSKKQALADIADNATVSLDAENLLDETTAGQILVSAFDQLVVYMTTGQDASGISAVFEGGSSNDFYKGLKESIKKQMVTDSRKASSLTIPSIVLTSMTQVGKETYLLDFSATYDFYYDKSTDTSKNTYGNLVQQLTGQLTLTKSGETYVVAKSGQKSITVISEDNQVKADSVFPDNLVGTWKGKMGDNTVTMTFAEDGTVTQTIDYKDEKTADTTHSAKVTKLEEKASGLYHYVYDDGADESTFVTGGLGGAGIKYTYGVKIDGDKLTPVVWQTSINGDFDYSKPLTGETLTKQ